MSDCPNQVTCCGDDPFNAPPPPPAPTIYWNVSQSFTANCTGGAAGSNTVTIAAGTYFSYVSQADANAQALAAATYQANAGLTCTPPVIEGQLSGLVWAMPCLDVNQPCACVDPGDQTVTLLGDSSHTYQVTLRFRGVVELNPYSGGGGVSPQNPLFFVDAAGPFSVGNSYALEVSAPHHKYYLNNNYNSSVYCVTIDYQVTVPMTGGATVVLSARAGDGLQVRNYLGLQADNVPPLNAAVLPQPYNGTNRGQFIQVDVISVAY